MDLSTLSTLTTEQMVMYGLIAFNLLLVILIVTRTHKSENYEAQSDLSFEEKMAERRNKQAALVQAILKKNEAVKLTTEAKDLASVAGHKL